ncbi:hypothetical protein DQ04_15991000 [Trypanosoma grayi]|uniref:hypothetical protein n=1 Tax=Trypanosoma grayi TaxID=71804 RepID=UPI0004F49928|nr:hypothetical protein DQ04_15991000 [Trypanosoma grayi]KEG06091.1 hypothetical protein DQ04_15991000 [Trypanosoma grayi]
MQQTVAAIEEFIEARDALGRWIDERESGAGGDERYYSSRNANEEEEEEDTAVELVGVLWRSAFFWVAVLDYIEALSLSSAKVNAFALRPKYEQALMQLLNSVAVPRFAGNWQQAPLAPAPSATSEAAPAAVPSDNDVNGQPTDNGASALTTASDVGPSTTIATTTATNAAGRGRGRGSNDETDSARADRVTRLLADLAALTNCPTDNPDAAGINPTFYAMVHARLNVLAACDRLDRFSATAAVAPPPLTPSLQALQAQRDAIAASRQRREMERENRDDIGVPLDFVPNEAYMRAALEKQNDTLGEDEELFKDEIVDYYKRHPQPTAPGRRGNAPQDARKGAAPAEEPVALVKPHRFCKVKTGYTWTQYNRTHYDSRTNPPPRSVLWYEFTLFYPALANTTRDMSRIYHIEDTPKGPNGDYCILVFSVGPPYADVAYQIVRKQWDTRPGGVRASFDSSGTYRLFFRFTNSNYRR